MKNLRKSALSAGKKLFSLISQINVERCSEKTGLINGEKTI